MSRTALELRPALSLERVQRTIYRAMNICARFYYGPGGPDGLDPPVGGYLQSVFNGPPEKVR